MKPSPLPPGTKQVLVSFEASNGYGLFRYLAPVSAPFLPQGLVLWGVTEETFVTQVRVGNLYQQDIGAGRIPGRYFEGIRPFERLLELAEQGELENVMALHEVLELREAAPGTSLSLTIEGPCTAACMWGRTYIDQKPWKKVIIDGADVGPGTTWRGRVLDRGLSGDRTVLEVECPDLHETAQLLAAFGRRGERA